jgi:two-component system response regulator RegX3
MNSKSSPKAKILIVEDEDAIRDGLCDVFIYNGYEVHAVANGKEGLKEALTGRYHLVILDVMLPGMDGLAICNEVRKVDRAQPIILLTAKGDEEDIIQGLKLGADDYIPKPFSVRELVARAEAVLRRSPKLNFEREMIHWGPFEIDPANLEAKVGGKEIELTRRELDLIRYLIKHAERPVSRHELLKEVWGYGNTQMETRTVDIHITKLRRKIEPDPQEPTYLVTVRGEGYRMMGA